MGGVYIMRSSYTYTPELQGSLGNYLGRYGLYHIVGFEARNR